MVKRVLLSAYLLLAFAGAAFAQSGQLGAGQVWGNSSAAQRPGQPTNLSPLIDQAIGSTRGTILERGASGWALLGPGTSGLPLVSAGAGADPAYNAVTSITGVGTLTAGATGTGFTLNFTNSTQSGVIGSTHGGAGTVSGILKGNGAGTVTAAVASTDYAPATTGSTILLGNGTGGFATYAGTSCTNQFPRSLSTAGAATCATVANTDLANSSLTIGTTNIALGATSLTLAGVTSYNKVAITAPATGSTITILDGKTFTSNKTITLDGTDSTTWTGPSTNATLAALNIASQTVTGGANVTSLAQSTGNITIDCGARPLQTITNGGAFTVTAPANDGSCLMKVTNNATAGAVTFSGFTTGTTGDPLDTVNGHIFLIFFYRLGGVSTYVVKALQ